MNIFILYSDNHKTSLIQRKAANKGRKIKDFEMFYQSYKNELFNAQGDQK